MIAASSTDLAIALAIRNGALVVTEEAGRFGSFWAISDDRGLIEVHNTRRDAADRINAISKRAA